MSVTVKYLPSAKLFSISAKGRPAVRASKLLLRNARSIAGGRWIGELESADLDQFAPRGWYVMDLCRAYVAAARRLGVESSIGAPEAAATAAAIVEPMAFLTTKRGRPSIFVFDPCDMTAAESAAATR